MNIDPIVKIKIKNGGEMSIQLFPDIAPATVENFLSLIKKEFYDGLIFHRVIPGFMIQGGCPNGTGTGGPGYSIKGEFASNGFKNSIKHQRGVLSMARSANPDSAGSQFFIMVDHATHLDNNYAAFGKIIKGIEEVDKIAGAKRDSNDKPFEDIFIETIRAEYKKD